MRGTADQRGMFFAGDGIMEAIREYLLSITAAGILCSVVKRILGEKGTSASVGKLITALFMVITVISPIKHLLSIDDIDFSLQFRQEAKNVVQDGENYASVSIRKVIEERTEAYILEKAKDIGAEIDVTVYLTEDVYPIPYRVRISGYVSPLQKLTIRKCLEELGIAEEDQEWI